MIRNVEIVTDCMYIWCPTTMGFPTKNDHFGVFWGYQHFRKPPYIYLGCDIGGAKELGVIYFPTNWGAKEPQNLPNHRVDMYIYIHSFMEMKAT